MCIKAELGIAIASGVAAVGTFVTAYLMYRSRPLAMRTLEKHSEELRAVLKSWEDEFDQYCFDAQWQANLVAPSHFGIEANPLFDDLANHMPSGIALIEDFKELKDDLLCHFEELNDIWRMIQKDAERQTKLPYYFEKFEETLGVETDFINDQFVQMIYDESLRLASGAASKYPASDKKIVEIDSEFKLIVNDLRVACTSSQTHAELAHQVLVLTLDNLNKDATPESVYVSRLQKSLDKAEELNERRRAMLKTIEELQLVAIFPGKCKFIRWSKK